MVFDMHIVPLSPPFRLSPSMQPRFSAKKNIKPLPPYAHPSPTKEKPDLTQMATVPERLKALIRYVGVSQAQFARDIGLSPGLLCRILLGHKNCSAETFNRVAQKFHGIFTPDELGDHLLDSKRRRRSLLNDTEPLTVRLTVPPKLYIFLKKTAKQSGKSLDTLINDIIMNTEIPPKAVTTFTCTLTGPAKAKLHRAAYETDKSLSTVLLQLFKRVLSSSSSTPVSSS